MKRPLWLLLAAAACVHAPPEKPAPPPSDAQAGPTTPGSPPRTEPPPTPPAAPGDPALPAPGPLPANDAFAPLRSDVDALLRAQGEALWSAWTRGVTPDLSSTYAGRERLLSARSVREVHAAMRAASGDERRALELLHGFLAGEHLARETTAAADRLARARTSAPVVWNGQKVSAERVPALLAAESDASRRAALQRALALSVASWAPAADAQVADLDAAARRLGHASLVELAAEIRGETPDGLARLAEQVLDATGPAYEAAMDGLARSELALPLEAVRGRDLPRLLRSIEDPRLFPAARIVADARALFGGLGLDPAGRAGVTLDLAPRPRKDARTLALPVDVPGDVRLSATPRGGVLDVRALLHEMGAVAYYSQVTSPRVEFRRLGGAVPRTWSLLFEEVAGDPAWLVERTGDTEHHLAPVVHAAAARRLHLARDAALRLLLELRRPRDPARARELVERAWARPVSQDETTVLLAARDPLLQSADALRAILLAAEAEVFLGRRARGAPWWRDGANGAWLRRVFAEGSRLSPQAIAEALGERAIAPGALAEVARERVRWADER